MPLKTSLRRLPNSRRRIEIVLGVSFGVLAVIGAVAEESVSIKSDSAKPELIVGGLVEYLPGTLPLIISAPHGGRLGPETIPDRRGGVKGADVSSDLLALEIVAALQRRTGASPHLVICHLKRSKVDCNRDALTGTEGHAAAMAVWQAYHDLIEQARRTLDRGLLIDLHGHGHPERRVELGHRLSGAQLGESAESLAARESDSSISALASGGTGDFLERLRGPSSLGGLLEARGYPSIPSPKIHAPGESPYFQGGFTVERYRSRSPDDLVAALQMETPLVGIRDTEENRRRFAEAFAEALETYFQIHLGINFPKVG
jgi:hypothetical protein